MLDAISGKQFKVGGLSETEDLPLVAPQTDEARKPEAPPASKKPLPSSLDHSNSKEAHSGGFPVRPRAKDRNRRKEFLLGAGMLLLAAFCWLGWRYGVPHTVPVERAEASLFYPEITGPGTLDATGKASIASNVQGRLLSLDVDENDAVKVGDLLARLDDEEAKAQLASLEASYEASHHTVVMAKADLKQTLVSLENAKSEFERQVRLLETKTTSRSSYETAQTALARAEADKAKAEATVNQSQSQMMAAAKNAEAQRAQLDKYRISAPITGIVINRSKDIGDTVNVGSTFIEIVDPSSIVITTRFDESLISKVALKQKAFVSFSANPDAPISARVTRIGRLVDEETREFEVDVKPDHLPFHWAVGQRATVKLELEAHPLAIAIPAVSLVYRNGQSGVWLSENGRARWQPVTLGAVAGERIEILSGLSSGDKFVSLPGRLYAGRRLRPLDAQSKSLERS